MLTNSSKYNLYFSLLLLTFRQLLVPSSERLSTWCLCGGQ